MREIGLYEDDSLDDAVKSLWLFGQSRKEWMGIERERESPFIWLQSSVLPLEAISSFGSLFTRTYMDAQSFR